MKKEFLRVLFTIVALLFPLLSLYKFFGTLLSIGDVACLITICLILILDFDKKVFSKMYIGLAVYIIIHTVSIYIVDQPETYITFFGRMFRLLMIYFLVSIAGWYFDKNVGKKTIVLISFVSTIYLIIQVILSTQKIYVGGGIPGLEMFNEGIRHYVEDVVKYNIRYRPRSIFSEPAHFCQYVIVAICVLLFDNNKNKITWPMIIVLSIGIIASMSLIGLVALTVAFGIFIFHKFMKSDSEKRKKMVIISIVLLPLVIFVLFKTPFIESTLLEKFKKQSITSDGRFEGFELIKEFFSGNIFRTFWGYGIVRTDIYLNGFLKTIYSFGIIGLIILIWLFVGALIKNKNDLVSLSLLMVLCVLTFGAEFIYGQAILVYFCFCNKSLSEEYYTPIIK